MRFHFESGSVFKGALVGCLIWILAIVLIAWLLVALLGFEVAVVAVLLLIFLAALVRD